MAKGLYRPIHPEKYLGDPTKIRFLSSWERVFMQVCDVNPNIIAWGSEEFRIPYFHPIKQKVTNYIPDFIIKYKDKNGVVLTKVIEIKPKKEVFYKGRKKISTYDQVQLVINHAKWTAAKAFCETHKISFEVLTEDNLFRT